MLEHECCDAFCMMVYAKGDESEWHDGYKWFNRISIHWAFAVTNPRKTLSFLVIKNFLKSIQVLLIRIVSVKIMLA